VQYVSGAARATVVNLVSFGFRYGLPSHADMVLDVRFLPNPYFVPELKPHPGTDPRVESYVLAQPDALAFLDRAVEMCEFLLPRYRAEGKSEAAKIRSLADTERAQILSKALAAAARYSSSPVK